MCLPESSTNPQVPLWVFISTYHIAEEQHQGPLAACLFPGLLPLTYSGEERGGAAWR